VEWNWQGKTEVLREKPVPVPLCPPQIPHRLTRDRTRVFAVRGRRLTAWVMARPNILFTFTLFIKILKYRIILHDHLTLSVKLLINTLCAFLRINCTIQAVVFLFTLQHVQSLALLFLIK
jgi:hypothetical protein